MPLVAMAFLWTGSQIPLYLFGAIPPYSNLLSVFKAFLSADNLQSLPRYWRNGSMDVVCVGQPPCSCIHLPICWVAVGPFWAALCRHSRRIIPYLGYDCGKYCAHDEYVYWRDGDIRYWYVLSKLCDM